MAHKKSVFLHSPELEQFSYPGESPFKTNRAALTRKTIFNMGLLSGDDRAEIPPAKATRADLEKFHKPEYLDAILAAEKGNLTSTAFAMGLGTPDCPVFKGMFDYACLASGATITGAKLILAGEVEIAFNPSGGYHHAFPDRAAGFCYINDVVLAAMTFLRAGKRVAFVDLDVHHCDGVQSAFYDRTDVMTISLHESGKTLFPGTGFEGETGTGAGKGFSVNVPLPVGTYDAVYKRVFDATALPLVRAYNPDVLMIELGMDALAGDPLAHLHLTNNVYADILEELIVLGKPILATGGGGYNVENTVRAWALLWSVMCGEHTEDLSIGMGGVMLASTEWAGGLRDRVLLTDAGRHGDINAEIDRVIGAIRSTVFPLHGLQ